LNGTYPRRNSITSHWTTSVS